MIATIQHNSKKYKADLSKPLDISIPISSNKQNVNAWNLEDPEIFTEEFNGKKISVLQGAPVNFRGIKFNPHSHITHTECVGHITKEIHSINKNLKQFFFLSELITVVPETLGKDLVISKKQLQLAIGNKKRNAIVIRTLPNTEKKKSRRYSHTNPPYFLEEAMQYLKEKKVAHLLVDLPSVDKEADGGLLKAHNTFWDTAEKTRFDASITEFIYVPNSIKDGTYLLNLMIAPFENDATPSKPVLYEIIK